MVVYAVIADHGYDGLVIATFMAGLILLIAGFLRASSLIRHIPEQVINGITIGIAVIIASSQVADFFGLAVEGKDACRFPAQTRGPMGSFRQRLRARRNCCAGDTGGDHPSV